MTSKNRINLAGFTIIELLIVLAMAGIILMLVLMAIPALERNSRNNQRRQDVQEILQEVSHYELTHSGDIPSTGALHNELTNSVNKLTYYDPNNPTAITVTFSLLGQNTPIILTVNDPDMVNVYNHAKCNPNSPGQATSTGAGYDDVAAMFAIETASGISPQCQNL